MALRLSPGTVNTLLGVKAFNAIFAGGFLDIYSGPQPSSAGDAASGTKLCTLYSDGQALGIHFEAAAVNGTISKDHTETWSGTMLANGTAGWFRLREATDSGVNASQSACRIDGAIATSGAQMNLGVLTFTQGAPFVVTSANFTLPTA